MEKPTFSRVKRAQEREKVLRYSIRKYGFGAASVAVAALYLFMGRGAVYAAETSTGANAPETTEMAATPEGEGEIPAEVAAAIQSGKEKIKKTTQEKIAALKADKTLSPEKLKELTTDVELSSKTTEGLLDALGGTLNVQQVEELVNQALDAIQNAEKAADTTETEEMEENAPAGGEAGNEQPGTDNSAGDEEESDEEVQNTLNSLKDSINQQKEAAIAEVKASKEGSEQEKQAAIAAINAWAEKTNKELDKAYEAGADSEELTAKSEELVKEFEKAFEGEEETPAPKENENTDKPAGEMKPEDKPSTPAPKEEAPAGNSSETANTEEESDEEVAKTLDGLKMKITEQKDAAISSVNSDSEATAEEKKEDIAFVNAWADKTNKELDKAYEAGADSEELTAKANELTEELIKYFEAGEEGETTDKPSGEMKPEDKPSTPAPKEEAPAPVDRTAALKAISDAKTEQEAKINENEGLSDDEAADALEQIGEEAAKAEKAVNDAKTQDAVNEASQTGVAEIKTVNPVAKEYAVDEIDTDLADKKAEIAKDTKLTDEQKKTITAALDKGAQEIREAIGVLPEYGDTDEEATGVEQQIKKLVDGFKEALKQATQEMPKEEIPAPKEDETADKPAGEMKPEENPSTPTPKEETPAPVDRTAALKAIEDAKMAQGQAVEDNEVLSENEVTAAKDKIAKAEEAAKKAINEATSPEAVEKAKEAGLAAIKAINPVGKEVPIDDLQDVATSRKAEIAKNDKLTPAEKEAANKKIDASVDKIVKGIKATLPSYVDTPEDVEEMNQLILNLVNKFKAGLEKVGVPTIKEEPKAETPAPVDRTAALKAIEDAKTEQIEKVNNNEGISESEAAAALALIEEEAGKAVKAVNEATTQEAIDKASQAGVAKVKAVNPVGKEFALDEITTDLDAKKAEIAKNTQLSDEQKKTIATELDQAAELIKASINSLPAYGETAKAAKDTEDKILELVQGFKEALKEATPETPKAETPAPKENPKLAEFKKAVKAAQEKKLAAIKAADYLGADKQKELEEQLNTLVSLILTGLEETPAEELTDANKESMLADIEGIKVPSKPEDKPKADESVAPSKPEDKPKADEPVAPSKPEDKPKTDEPVAPSKPEDKPKADEPVAPSKPEDKPEADEPVAPSKPEDKPKADEPVAPSKPEAKPQTDTPTTGTTPKTEVGKPTETSAPAVSTTPVAPTMRTLEDSASHARISATSQALAGVDHLAVEKVKAAVLEGKEYDAFDIELRDAQNKAVQPHGAVTVTLPARKAVEAVYYIDANNKLASQSFTQEGDMVTFTTDHFSVYALVYKADQAPASKTDSKESKKELPNTGDTTPTVSFLVGIGLALMGILALKHKED